MNQENYEKYEVQNNRFEKDIILCATYVLIHYKCSLYGIILSPTSRVRPVSYRPVLPWTHQLYLNMYTILFNTVIW